MHLNPPNTSDQNANKPCNNKNQFSDIPNHALSHLEQSTHAICQQSSTQQHKQKSPFNSNPTQHLPHNDQNTVHTYSTKHRNNNRVMFPYLSAISKRQQSNVSMFICQHWYLLCEMRSTRNLTTIEHMYSKAVFINKVKVYQ